MKSEGSETYNSTSNISMTQQSIRNQLINQFKIRLSCHNASKVTLRDEEVRSTIFIDTTRQGSFNEPSIAESDDSQADQQEPGLSTPEPTPELATRSQRIRKKSTKALEAEALEQAIKYPTSHLLRQLTRPRYQPNRLVPSSQAGKSHTDEVFHQRQQPGRISSITNTVINSKLQQLMRSKAIGNEEPSKRFQRIKSQASPCHLHG
ncbi:hypothetical protein K4F52_009476 [Lecanicillium sp. MT-2017a]|nr:hypothetical protein K4F52_009476 [Lecanicillium sp. MT-2017a]